MPFGGAVDEMYAVKVVLLSPSTRPWVCNTLIFHESCVMYRDAQQSHGLFEAMSMCLCSRSSTNGINLKSEALKLATCCQETAVNLY